MSESAIRTKIRGIMLTVADIGVVHDYERFAGGDWGKFIEFFRCTIGGKEQIRGWELCRKAAPARYDSNGEETTTHQFVIRGYRGVRDADATEKDFNVQIEAVREKFRFNFTLDGLCELAGPVSVEAIDVRMFGSVLCHYCELSLPVQELYSRL